MIKWLKKSKNSATGDLKTIETPEVSLPEQASESSINRSFFARLKAGLTQTTHQLGEGIGRIFLGKKEIDASLLEELEIVLLRADLGIEITQTLVQQLKDNLARKQLADGEAVFNALRVHLEQILMRNTAPLNVTTANGAPFVILMVGINGAGKTTTIGKLAQQYQRAGKKVMLAAGDTFRAAAGEQLQIWGDRNHIPVIAQHSGADSASVIFDALQAAKARHVDVLIADTAGRLHTQNNLMEELKKVKRVLQKIDPAAPHEIMLVLDASLGQNALNQARQFYQAVGVTGITMTKLDGTAKGGILFAIAHELAIPFRYIGIGEGIDDLRPFDAKQFVDVIFKNDNI